MSRILSMLLAAACLLPALDAVAQPLPEPIKLVYRADSRPPEDMFASGFFGRGSNMDLLAHTLGGSCEETNLARASTWVSMSAEHETAIGFATGRLEGIEENGPEHSMWIYTIRPDETYLDVRSVIQSAAFAGWYGQQGYTSAQGDTLAHLLYSTLLGSEREVVAHYVAPANIVSAQNVYFNEGGYNLVRGTIATNPCYRALDTQASDVVADLHAFVPAASIRDDYDSDSDSEGSCSMSCDGSVESASSRSPLAVAPRSAHCKVRNGFSPMLLDIIND
ncbi:hypothetical protein [Noviluteimonas gilva]|uniref:Pertussis toxin subunit 1 n=1 Tax=Noviluteimonas gilva TaxID=2682097 RepID=A0A7C9HS08_9GAMM|nr:hypothetical protein [Lysobacter gilvus]MUV14053.1 hypothetical protein [Lysobacter gilvus]